MFAWQFIDAGERALRGTAPRQPTRGDWVRTLAGMRREFFAGCWLGGGEPYAAPFFPRPVPARCSCPACDKSLA